MSARVLVLIGVAAALAGSCARRTEPAKAESASLNVTDWTARTELYMEYPPLVAGQPALFAERSAAPAMG